MHVAVAIVGFRNPDDILRCLDALGRSSHADFEVIVCENGGPSGYDALRAVIPSKLPGGQIVRTVCAPGNLGFAGGVNICLAQTPRADAWWVLNPDTEPHCEALAAKLAVLRQGYDAVGCTLYRPDGRVQSDGGLWRPWLARQESIGMGRDVTRPADRASVERRQRYLNGAAMLIGRDFLDRAGPMREDYFLYCEEVEWCVRGQAAGLRLGFAPGALILHAQGTTTGAAAALKLRPRLPVYLSARNMVLVTRDCYPGRVPMAVLAAAVQLGLRYAKGGAWTQLRYALSGLMAGLRNERGPPAWLGA
jgi:GT2 family glycosyltransferase